VQIEEGKKIRTIDLTIERKTTCSDLMNIVEAKAKIPITEQCLFFG